MWLRCELAGGGARQASTTAAFALLYDRQSQLARGNLDPNLRERSLGMEAAVSLKGSNEF